MPRRRRQSVAKLVRNEILKQQKQSTEVKHKTVSYAISAGSTPYGYNMLEYIGEGDSATNRDGNRINLLSQSMRMNMTGETPYSNIRVMVVETRQPLPYSVLSGLYEGSDVLQTPSLGINSSLDFDTVKKVFYDRTFTLREIIQGTAPVRYLRKYLRHGKTGKKCFYDGNTTGLNSGNIRTHLYVLFMSDSIVTPHPRITAGHYMRFTDK